MYVQSRRSCTHAAALRLQGLVLLQLLCQVSQTATLAKSTSCKLDCNTAAMGECPVAVGYCMRSSHGGFTSRNHSLQPSHGG